MRKKPTKRPDPLEDARILNAMIRDGKWLELLTNDEDPSYDDMHALESDDGRNRIKVIFGAVSAVLGQDAVYVKSCIYFFVHYWWDCYMVGDDLTKPILETWTNQQDAREADIVVRLREFNRSYPPKQWLDRSAGFLSKCHPVYSWLANAAHLKHIRDTLLAGWTEVRNGEARYKQDLFAITNLYVAEASRFESGGDEAISKLLRQSIRHFEAIGDEFTESWAYWELADYLADQNARAEAQEQLSRALNAIVDAAADDPDSLDAELMSNCASTQASMVAAGGGNEVAAYALYILSAHFAYCFLGREKDEYSSDLYKEKLDRLKNWTNSNPSLLDLSREFFGNGKGAPVAPVIKHADQKSPEQHRVPWFAGRRIIAHARLGPARFADLSKALGTVKPDNWDLYKQGCMILGKS